MENYTATTSTVDERFWDDMEEGYRAGYQRALNEFNDRLMTWLMVGLCVGMGLGYFFSLGWMAFLSVLVLIHLVEKVTKIQQPPAEGGPITSK